MSRRRKPESREGVNLGLAAGRGAIIGGIAFVLSLALAAFSVVGYAKSYLKSAAFRDQMAGGIAKVLKARAELEPVNWDGSSAFTNRFRAQGYEDAAFGLLDIAGARVELDLSAAQFRRGVWKVPEVVVSQVMLDLSNGVKLPGQFAVEAKPAAPAAPEPGAEPEKGNGLLAGLLPSRVEIDTGRINNFNLVWTEQDQEARAVGIQTVVTPTVSLDAFQVDARGGAIHRPGQPKLDIDRVMVRIKDGSFFISDALFRTQQGAELHLEGDILTGKGGKAGNLVLRADVTHLKLTDLVAEGWRQRVKGDVTVSAKVEGDPGNLENALTTGTVTLNNGVLEAFPILETLATYTGSERFRRVALRDGASAKFTRRGRSFSVEGIDIQSDGLARLTGELDIEDGVLAGKMRLGVVPGSMTWLPGAEKRVFTESREGYLWTDVTVSGTVEDPHNDLVAKLASAGVETAIETLMDPAARKESVEDVLGIGREILRGFLGR